MRQFLQFHDPEDEVHLTHLIKAEPLNHEILTLLMAIETHFLSRYTVGSEPPVQVVKFPKSL